MSESATDEGEGESPPLPRAVLRTVSPPYRGRPDAEMSAVGLAYLLGIAVLLVPLLPFVVLVWVISKVVDGLADLRGRA